ncbi:hypothetical protein QEN19_001476 [Hanseniaspora menglaensis]
MSNIIDYNAFYELEQRLENARKQTKQLYTQINYVKSKNQDSDLHTMSRSMLSTKFEQEVSLNSNLSFNKYQGTREQGCNLRYLRTLNGHHNKIADLKWSQDSTTILSASQDGFMILWDASTGLKKNAVLLENQWVLSCAISPNKKLAASAGLDNHCTIYKIDKENTLDQRVVAILKGHTGYISECEFISNYQILSASGDMTACKWDIIKGMKLMEYTEHLGDILALSTPKRFENSGVDSFNNNVFATAGSDGYLLLWDSRQRNSAQKFLIGDTDVGCLQFFSDNNAIAAGSDDGLVRLFDLRADCKIAEYSVMHQLHKLKEYSNSKTKLNTPQNSYYSTLESSSLLSKNTEYDAEGVLSMDFSNSGRLLYACYPNYGCVVWDTLKGEVVGMLQDHSSRINKVKSSNNGFGVMTGSWDNSIKMWTPGYT